MSTADQLDAAEALIREWDALPPEQYRIRYEDRDQRFRRGDAYDLLLTHMLGLVRDDVGSDLEEVVLDLINHGEGGVGYEWLIDELIHRQIELQPAIWDYFLRLSELFDNHNRYDWTQQRPAFSENVPLGARRRFIVTGTVDRD